MASPVAGEGYVKAITLTTEDRRTRASFQSRVLSLVPPGAALFDFGAGPGIDAGFYARHGFSVDAYDTDPAMLEYLRAHCREAIAAGQIRVHATDYASFLTGAARGERAIDLVASNFAPFNLVTDLPALFAALAPLTGPSGQILAGVLNPYFPGDLKYGWWWRGLLSPCR